MDRRAGNVSSRDTGWRGDRALADLWTSIGAGDTERAVAIAAYIQEVRPPAEVAATVEAAVGLILQRAGRPVESRDRFETAAAMVPALPARASYLADAAMSRFLAGDLAGAERRAVEVRRLGTSLGNWFAVCESTHTLAGVLLCRGEVREGHRLARAAVQIGGTRLLGEGGGSTPHLFLGAALIDLDRFEEAEQAFGAGLTRVLLTGSEAQAPWFLGFRALGRLLAGQWDAALVDVETCLATAERTGTTVTRALACGVGALVTALRGETVRAAELLDAAGTLRLGAFGGFGEETLLLARSVLAERREDRAAALSQAWLLRRTRPYFLAWRSIGPPLVRNAVLAGDRRLATAVTEEAEEGAALAGGVPSAQACALRCRGLLEGDAGLLEAAVEPARRAGRPFALAHGCLDAAKARMRAGEPQRAVPLLAEAREAFTGLGVRAGAELAGALLAEVTGVRPLPGLSGPQGVVPGGVRPH